MKHLLVYITLVCTCAIAWGRDTVQGNVFDAVAGDPMPYVSVSSLGGRYSTMTDDRGQWSLSLPHGQHKIVVSFPGYKSDTISVVVPGAAIVKTTLQEQLLNLREVVVTARENQGTASSSHIDRDAMQHLQPTSFTDLLELLPGNISQTPEMGKANTITLRETGTITATGIKTSTSDDYSITSLGTMFLIDGAPVNTDASMQYVPSAASSDPEGKRNIINKGVDMRSISTDNIESVEIVRGIPSAEYGNLTSGMVNIKRVHRASPFVARFKADQYSKLFSAGKGIALSEQLLNLDLGYLDSRSDPRDPRENYKRLTASGRAYLKFGRDSSTASIAWNVGCDYTSTLDNAKTDPDLNCGKIDEYMSSYRRWALTSNLIIYTPKVKWLDNINLNSSVSYEHSILKRLKQVAPQRASVAPSSMTEGVNDGSYLLSEYTADYRCYGKPFSAFAKLSAYGSVSSGVMRHNYKAGVEYQGAKNYGEGEVYDLSRPLSASWTTRPRKYKDIPGINIVSGFIEDSFSADFSDIIVEAQAGLRFQTMLGLDSRYTLSGKLYPDPRFNTLIRFPAIRCGSQPLRFSIGGGYGLTTKMPTSDYLFPQKHYIDLIQLNYYDPIAPAENSKVSLRTYIADATNYSLRAARNLKWELRVGADMGVNRISVTFFNEKMRSGFRYSTCYDAYTLRRYDASAILPGSLSAPPALSALPYTDTSVLSGYRRTSNGSRIDKTGIEYQLNTARWSALATSLIINGAWFRSRYSNSQMLYAPVSDVVNSTPVSEKYVGIYACDDGRVNEQLNTNFMFDTQIPRWGLVFTTSVQCMWYVKTRRLRDNSTPSLYLSADDGLLHPYTETERNDPVLQHLVRSYNETAYATVSVPPAIYINLKATKQIGHFLKISAFVNRIIDYLPDYKSNGLTVCRSSGAYFGMEATLSI